MTVRRVLAHGFVFFYCFVTFLAFMFTMFRWKPLGFTFIFPAYGMMAPYQGYAREHRELVADGRMQDGTVERISMRPYYPGRQGEGVVRQQMRMIEWFMGREAFLNAYRTLATRIQHLEAEEGRVFVSIQLSWEVWPVSLEGYEHFRHAPFTRLVPVVAIP